MNVKSKLVHRYARLALVAITVAAASATLMVFRAGALPSLIDLDATPADVTVSGNPVSDGFGGAVATGDINGDTIDDFIVGALAADPGGRNRAGEAYVVDGSGTLPATINLASASLAVLGDDISDELGTSLATGDINGDTIDDLIIGAPSGTAGPGKAYVIYGGPALPTTIDLASTAADLTVIGKTTNDKLGESVAAGDVDGDTIDDLIVGAGRADPAGRTSAGEAYVIYGGPALPTIIDLNTTSPDVTIWGASNGFGLGTIVAAGDITGDGTADLILRSVTGSAADVEVFYGGSGFPSVIDMASVASDYQVISDGTGDWSIGSSITTGDVNDDGTQDLILGADRIFGDGDKVYVMQGGPALPSVLSVNGAMLTVAGEMSDPEPAGPSVAAADIDGDTIEDLIIGASGLGTNNGEGKAYIIYGSNALPTSLDLENEAAGVTISRHRFATQKASIVAAGDVNGDTTADLIIGAERALAPAFTTGQTYVIYGSPRPTPTPTPTPCPGVCPTITPTPIVPTATPCAPEGCPDADQDGCSDAAENGPNENLGGQRNSLYFWDFYDVWTHPPGDPTGWERNRVINLFDIIAVAMRFGPGLKLSKEAALAAALTPPTNDTGYHVGYDRGPIQSANKWDREPPDGDIGIPNDILGVAIQFGHNCT